jgi:Ser/Thr protein kinase RdoA (MazF antagonist)
MECAPETALTWKQRLLGGELDMPTARNAGAWLRVFHEGSAGMSVERRRGLDGFRYFEQLRLDPFHRYVMEKYPALRTTIQSLIEQLKQPVCMVHGDFSPKNILVDGNANVIVLDFEVAHWGNPVFDAAFCLTHLILKALIFGPLERYDHLIGQFMAGYGELPAGICAHIGLLLLARVDGKSPADYIRTEPQRQRIRQIAMRWIATAEDAGKSGEGEAGNVLRLLRQEKARTNG